MRFVSLLLALFVVWPSAFAQTSAITSSTDATSGHQSADSAATQTNGDGESQADENPAMFEHPSTTRYWLSGQSNIIFQYHPSFPAKYSGVNSLQSFAQHATSRVFTLYTGYEIGPHTEVILDVESAGGHGLSEGAGLAGFTDLDIVRTPNLGQAPYVARLMIRRIIPLSTETTESERSPISLATELPVRRVEIRFGKFSMVDFFDANPVGGDSHLQFMNWTDDNNGAYDYAANTRGYTWGALVEYDDRRWSARFAETLMPKVANGENLDADFTRARAENVEVEFRRQFLPHRDGAIRLLSYVNHADMGSYRQSIQQFFDGLVNAPDITATRQQERIKYGFGVNLEQDLGHGFRGFARWGWNNGRTESFAYTEVDQTVTGGGDLAGRVWHRRHDRVGAAFISNAISGDHREYLKLGGTGFLLGDGGLNYRRERIFEGYYTAHLWRGLFVSADLQHITNPGYNRDRGPVLVPSARVHADF